MLYRHLVWTVPALVLLAASAPAQGPLALETIATDLENPAYLTAPPGDPRLFILEQPGRIRIVKDGQLLEAPFLDITSLAQCCGEQGLLGLAFDPDYAANGYFYINYTGFAPGGSGNNYDTRIVAYQVDPQNPDLADAGSATMLLTFAQPEQNHNGGWMAFGPDGYLYISTGDGGGGNDQHGEIGNGQALDTLLGKILRIDVNGFQPYTVPADNPFTDNPDARDEIWAYGLRNPWRNSFDRETGALYVADVGQSSREEVNYRAPDAPGGANYGWRAFEGSLCHLGTEQECEELSDEVVFPIHEYGRDVGQAITGGYVYRGERLPDWQGAYFFADYGSARVWTLRHDGGENVQILDVTDDLTEGLGSFDTPSSFGEDAAGELYITSITGNVYRVISEGGDDAFHSADTNGDWEISLSELLRAAQLYNAGAYACDGASPDGYAPIDDADARDCPPHDGDYADPQWALGLSEMLRLIQLYHFGAYEPCPDAGTPDGFCEG